MTTLLARSKEVVVKDTSLGLKILKHEAFAVDHPFRATRYIFGPTVLDTEGSQHTESKRSWLAEFRPENISSPRLQDIISEAIEAGFERAEEEDDLMIAAMFIPNHVLLCLLNADHIDPMEHYQQLRAATKYLETNQRTREAGQSKAYLTSDSFDARQCPMFRGLESTRRQREIALFAFAAAETTVIALKCLMLDWIRHNERFTERLAQQGEKDFVHELLRNDPPLGIATRYCKADVDIDDHHFYRGDVVHVSIVDINNQCPASQDSRVSTNLTFGTGKHACPGHFLAKQELYDVAQRLAEMDADDYELIAEQENLSRPMSFRDPGVYRIPRRKS